MRAHEFIRLTDFELVYLSHGHISVFMTYIGSIVVVSSPSLPSLSVAVVSATSQVSVYTLGSITHALWIFMNAWPLKWTDNGQSTQLLSRVALASFIIHELAMWSEAVYVSLPLAQSQLWTVATLSTEAEWSSREYCCIYGVVLHCLTAVFERFSLFILQSVVLVFV